MNNQYGGGPPGGYPPAGGYPLQGGYGAPAPGGYPAAGGYPGGAPQGPGYPSSASMGMPSAYDTSSYPGAAPGGMAYQAAPGGVGFNMGGPPGPGSAAPGYPPGQLQGQMGPGSAAPGYPPSQPQGQPGYPAQAPYGAPPQQPAGYGAPPQQPADYGAPPQQPAGYGAPPQQPAGYGAPQQPAGYGAPQQSAGYGAPQQSGYGAPQQPAGYGAPSQPYGAPSGMSGGYQPPGGASSGGAYPSQPYGGGQHPPGGGYDKSSSANLQPATQGTLRAAPNFNAENDSRTLRKAMKGFGTDEKAIIDILGYRTNAQRQQLRSLYKTCFGRDLIADLKSELSSHFERATVALMMEPAEYDAYELKRAMRGMGTDEHALIEILCSRSNQEIRNINEFYKRMFNSKLEQGLMNETSGHFRRLLVSMCNAGRMENQPVDINKAKQDAQSLYQAGEKQLGTDESMFNMIIASQSFPQLRAVFIEYKNVSGHDLDKAIGREFSGDIERGLRTIIQCVKDIPSYFADRLYHSMKGAGTDDQTLVRIVVTRCEVDMVQIKQVFQHKYGQSLEKFLRDDISGDYRKMILALVGGSWPREDLFFKMLRLD